MQLPRVKILRELEDRRFTSLTVMHELPVKLCIVTRVGDREKRRYITIHLDGEISCKKSQ